jgi:hypothetical protein
MWLLAIKPGMFLPMWLLCAGSLKEEVQKKRPSLAVGKTPIFLPLQLKCKNAGFERCREDFDAASFAYECKGREGATGGSSLGNVTAPRKDS